MSFIKFTLFCVLIVAVFGQQTLDSSVKELWGAFTPSQTKQAQEIVNNPSLIKADIRKKMHDMIESWGDEKMKVISRF